MVTRLRALLPRTPDTLLVGVCGALLSCEEEPPPPREPPPITAVVDVAKDGDGRGSWRSLPAGVLCDVDCDAATHTFADVASVVVVVEPDRDALFRGAECVSGAAATDVISVGTLDDAGEARLTLPTIVDGAGVNWSCTADFAQVQTLQVLVRGEGTGRIVGALSAAIGADEPRRVDCPGDCIGAYFAGETETLTAIPAAGSVFNGWRFCGSGSEPVTLVMDQDRNCDAVFDPAP
jgi:hypothetical protein